MQTIKRFLIIALISTLVTPSYAGILDDGVIDFDFDKEQKKAITIASMSSIEFEEYVEQVELDEQTKQIEEATVSVIKEAPLYLDEWIERHKYIYFSKWGHEDIQRYAYILANEYDMDYLFFIAVMLQESHMRAEATHQNVGGSAPGSIDRGIFQINSLYEYGYTKDYAASFDVFNALDNMIVSFKKLSQYFRKYNNYPMIAGMWNRGEGGILKYHMEDFMELPYVKSVLNYYYDLHREYVTEYLKGYENELK